MFTATSEREGGKEPKAPYKVNGTQSKLHVFTQLVSKTCTIWKILLETPQSMAPLKGH